MIDLGLGYPSDSILPVAALKEAALHRLSLSESTCLQYAEKPGNAAFRAAVAVMISEELRLQVSETEVLVTAGASHGLDLVISQLGQPGDTIIVEDPTYFLALKVFQDRHLNIVPVATDAEGLNIDDLQRQVARHRPRFLYTIPVHHNPTGSVMSANRRQQLVQLAKEMGFFIIADEVYQLLTSPEDRPASFSSYASEQVLSLGSFSKIFGPGLRLGWVHAIPRHIQQLSRCGVLQSSGGVSPLATSIMQSALELGLQQRVLETLRIEFDTRRMAVLSLFDACLPSAIRFTPPTGGFFCWLELPGHCNTSMILEHAKRVGLGFKPGVIFSCQGNFENCLRICHAYYDCRNLERACQKLIDLLQGYL